MGVSRNSEKRQQGWNTRAFGGNPVWWNFATGSDRHRTTHVTQANGRMVGNIGHPFFSDSHRRISMLTGRPASRRAHLRSHSGQNAGIALSHAPTAPEYSVPPHLFRVCWSGWPFHCQSPKRDAAGATNHLICRDTTSPLAQGRGDSRNVPLPLSAC